ncbi:MAG: PAS domain-containing sensor histidine kinase [Methanobacterium sp.]
MDLASKNDSVNKFSPFVSLLSILTIISGLLILIGWIFNIPVLTSPNPSYASTALTTSICFILVGISLFLIRKRYILDRNRKISNGLAIIVFLFGLVMLLDYIIDYTAGISIIANIIGVNNLIIYRISVVGAISFMLTGLAVIFIDNEPYNGVTISEFLIGIVGIILYLVEVGYIYQTNIFHISGTTHPSIYAAIIFNFITFAVLFSRPDKGIMEILVSDRLSGAFGRILLPAILILPLIFGGISLYGELLGLYDSNFSFSIMAVSTVIILLLILIRSLYSIDKIEVIRLKAEQKVKESAEEIEDLYNNAPCGYHSLDKDGYFVQVNDTELSWLEYTREELIGKNFKDILTKDSQKIFESSYEGFKNRGYVNDLEFELIRNDGSTFYIILSSTAIKDSKGTFLLSRSTLFDITELKHAQKERERLIEELKRSNEDLESFAHIASHDLQEPLRTMTSYAQLLKRRYSNQLDNDADEFIDYMVDGANRMQSLITGLLAYSRVGTHKGKFKDLSTEDAINVSLSNLKYAVKESNAKVTYDPLPIVKGDLSQITQVFQNLIGNGIKFRKEGIRPEIHISARKKDDSYIFSVSDNGIGIEEQYIDGIFEAFKRLHGTGEYSGSGIGLATVKRIIERHGGRIWVKSSYGIGSTFYFTIPI